MDDAIKTQDLTFDEIVNKYLGAQKKVIKNFVYGCIDLGEILSSYREKLKRESNWLKFLDTVGINVAQVNQQIRLYELSKEKIEKEMLASVITNRPKLNLFLALTDEEKEKVMERGLNETLTTADFREVITEIKAEDVVVIHDSSFEDNAWKKISEVSGENALLVDTKKTAKKVQQELKMSEQAINALEGVLFMEKAKEVLKTKVSLTEAEKNILRDLYATQFMEIQDALEVFFS